MAQVTTQSNFVVDCYLKVLALDTNQFWQGAMPPDFILHEAVKTRTPPRCKRASTKRVEDQRAYFG